MIEARRITKFFSVVKDDGTAEGATAVLSVSLKINDGAFVAIVGPTGCGKSTFLEILAGLQAPTEGEVFIDGRLVLEPLPATRREMDAYRKKYRFVSPLANGLFRDRPKHDIAMIFQDYAVFPWMTARENVLFTLKLRGTPRADREELARKYLDQVGLRGSGHKYPAQLSGGMRQRLAIARALSVEPKIILMDEPFAAVDALTRERLQEMLLDIWRTTRTTMVLVTHDFDEAVYLADEIIVFSPLPGTIRNRVPIDLPRPRHRDDPALRVFKERIVRMYHYDNVHAADYSI
ncbi:ABC transporter ATP-binding protein [Opitutaceae bacterium TAV4]|uniref:ABC transporter ATP-binding protein n=1 Tax=Geminisphaera colitermitum TaxID=1148786 RepID=UPI0001964F22|nr:ABC transporter ATP-binding protein [Geminisphaera colitermitum]RRJ96652.1 ABC transporter ATP-binding protein [Opitutaceae bacterium TAV4]RRK00699.1 ABC transporter ATP-binding protein [Opitutaceae bacterium TAV3]